MYDITKLKTLPEQVYENTVKLNETIEPAIEAAVEAANEATTKANEVYSIAESAQTTANEAKSTADNALADAGSASSEANAAYEKSVEAETAANTAIELANTNKEAIEALGDLDAEAIANLQSDVTSLKETSEKQELEISTVVAQVDAAEDDITDMKVTIASNTTSATRANNVADVALSTGNEALDKANDNAQSIVSLGDDVLDLEKSIGEKASIYYEKGAGTIAGVLGWCGAISNYLLQGKTDGYKTANINVLIPTDSLVLSLSGYVNLETMDSAQETFFIMSGALIYDNCYTTGRVSSTYNGYTPSVYKLTYGTSTVTRTTVTATDALTYCIEFRA